MSASRPKHALVSLILGVAAAATIAACDRAPTEPVGQLAQKQVQARTLGDTTSCRNGWTIVSGRYVCN